MQNTPVAVMGITDAVQVSASYLTCARRQTGATLCWGANSRGQIGNGGMNNLATPTIVAGVMGAQSVRGGRLHSCALTADSHVLCWGANFGGQLGNGSTTPSPAPTQVTNLADAIWLSPHLADSVCVVRMGGTVACWGANVAGQLGSDEATIATPAAVIGLPRCKPLKAL
jgi:alpha-tubulin suppressor-like RCC1 family protein